jgi:hypothetical protein
MQAIRTRYHGPRNTRGSRISAQCGACKIFVSYDHALNLHGNHAAAAKALQEKLGWTTDKGYKPMFGGGFNGDTYWVFSHPACALEA